MSLAKRRKNLFVFFLVVVLCLRPLWARLKSRKLKKEKQGITVTNKMTKGVLVIRRKKEITVKAKVARKKSFIKEDKKIFKFRSSNKKIVTVNKKGKNLC